MPANARGRRYRFEQQLLEQQLTEVFLPGESHGQRSPEGYSPGGRSESDTTE